MKPQLKIALVFTFSLPASLSMAQTTTTKNDTDHVIIKNVVFEQTEIDNTYENIERFRAYIKKNMNPIPNVHGSVMLSFKNREDGFITNIKVTKSLGKAADTEALRLMRAYPKWIPNTIEGKPISAVMTIPITFK